MNYSEPEVMRQVMQSIFKRKGEETEKTKIFESLPDDVQQELISKIRLGTTELPILASIMSPTRWLLVTTERFVCEKDGVMVEVDGKDISDFAPEWAASVEAGAKTLSECGVFSVSTGSQKHLFEVDGKGVMIGMEHLLLYITGRNNRSP